MTLPQRKRARTNDGAAGSKRLGGRSGRSSQKFFGPLGPQGQYRSSYNNSQRRFSRGVNACNKLSSWAGFGQALSGAALTTLKAKLGLNTEEKLVDFGFTNPGIGNTLANIASNLAAPIPQTLTTAGRVGNGVRMTSWSFSGYIKQVLGNANPLDTVVRIIIIDWGKVSGATALLNVSDILKATGSVLSPYNDAPVVTPRKVLYDEEFRLAACAAPAIAVPTGSTTQNSHRFEFQYTPTNHHITWIDSDTTGVYSNATEGLIAAYAISDCIGPGPTIDMYSRICYVDN